MIVDDLGCPAFVFPSRNGPNHMTGFSRCFVTATTWRKGHQKTSFLEFFLLTDLFVAFLPSYGLFKSIISEIIWDNFTSIRVSKERSPLYPYRLRLLIYVLASFTIALASNSIL